MHPVIKGAQFSTAATVIVTLKLNTGVTLPVPPAGAVTLAAFKAPEWRDGGVHGSGRRRDLRGPVPVPAAGDLRAERATADRHRHHHQLCLPVNVTVDAGD